MDWPVGRPALHFFYLWAQGKRKGGNDRCRLNHEEQPFVGVPSVSVSNRRHHCRLSLCSPKFHAALDITRPILGALSLHVSTCLCAPKIPRICIQTRHKQWSRLRSLQTTWLLSIAAHCERKRVLRCCVSVYVCVCLGSVFRPNIIFFDHPFSLSLVLQTFAVVVSLYFFFFFSSFFFVRFLLPQYLTYLTLSYHCALLSSLALSHFRSTKCL